MVWTKPFITLSYSFDDLKRTKGKNKQLETVFFFSLIERKL